MQTERQTNSKKDLKLNTVSYGKSENPATFICVGTSHKGDTQIKRMNYILKII